MMIDSAKDLQMNIAKEGLALLMLHPSLDVQLHRECIFLIGTAWDIPVGDTQEVISLLDRELDAIRAAGEGGTVAHVLPEDELPMNAIGFMGLHIITAGTYDGETYVHRDGENYKILFYKEDVLKGYILIGDVARAGIYTALIRNRTPLSSIDFKLICEKPQLMAFTARTRRDLLSKQQ